MSIERFIAYATDFEKTLQDDDWSRIEQYFHDDATYDVENVFFGCHIEGRDGILAGLRKSLDGFDRRMGDRRIEVKRGPVEADGAIEMDWVVGYSKPGAPDFDLVGSSVVRYDGDRIRSLIDRYPDGLSDAAEAWIREHAPDIDPYYV